MRLKTLLKSSALVFLCVILCSCSAQTAVNEAYFKKDETLSSESEKISESGLYVSFLDVGQADSIFVSCGGENMLIDGGNTADGDFVCSFLKSNGIDNLDYIISTHAHEDHVGGLCNVVKTFSVEKAIISPKKHDSVCYNDFINSMASRGIAYEYASHGTSFSLGEASIEIIGPISENPQSINSSSIVTRLSYNGVSFLFTGDCTSEEEKEILNAGYNVSATVLKSGHHGSDFSSSYIFLREVLPEYVVVSVGENNSYGHPGDNCLSRYRDVGATVYRTDKMGTITAATDKNGNLSFSSDENLRSPDKASEKAYENEDADAKSAADEQEQAKNVNSSTSYVGNKNSKIYHLPTCSYLPKEKNRVYFSTKKEASDSGYKACSYCIGE